MFAFNGRKMICLNCGINQISIVHLFYGFLPPKVSVGFLLSVSIYCYLRSCLFVFGYYLAVSSQALDCWTHFFFFFLHFHPFGDPYDIFMQLFYL